MITTEIADGLAGRLFEAERRIDDAVHGAAELLTGMIEARTEAGLPAAYGAEAQTKVVAAVTALTEARRAVGASHATLERLAKTAEVTLTGPIEKPPEEEPAKPSGIEQNRRAA